jgi:hypothetical protein
MAGRDAVFKFVGDDLWIHSILEAVCDPECDCEFKTTTSLSWMGMEGGQDGEGGQERAMRVTNMTKVYYIHV